MTRLLSSEVRMAKELIKEIYHNAVELADQLDLLDDPEIVSILDEFADKYIV